MDETEISAAVLSSSDSESDGEVEVQTRALKRKFAERDEEELALTKKLFGKIDEDDSDVDDEDEKEEFEAVLDEEVEEKPPQNELKPAWVDSEDEEAEVDLDDLNTRSNLRLTTDQRGQKISAKEYQERLKVKYERVVSRDAIPKWAQLPKEDEQKKADSDDDDVTETIDAMTRKAMTYIGKSEQLFKGALHFNRLRDITIGTSRRSPVNLLKFHPSRPVMITASQDGAVALYKVPDTSEEDSLKKSFFLQDTRFKKFPITSCELYRQSTALLVGSDEQSYLYSYDLVEGEVTQIDRPPNMPKRCKMGKFAVSHDGKYIAIVGLNSEVYVYTATSFEFIHTFVASSKISTLKFSTTDNNILFALTESGRVYFWDLARRGAQRFFIDDGAVRGTALAVGRNDAFIACGSSTGIVNVYKTNEAYVSESPKPFATYSNLTTSTDILAFNHDCQSLAFGSTVKMNAIRLSHMKTSSVYKNFPARTEMLQKSTITSAGFSPNSGFFACGTNTGAVRLYRLSHFENY
uniref:WD_REPEATS_REGION domain-containing protein n=1 Tax=Steinernema glaseri TaxID=37863 RepID=A0A1I7Z2Z4_9BILA